ncbi:MAG: DUF4388 domain-containing protein [Nitrospirota bacterium]
MGFSGRLEGIAPSDIFQIISQSRMTGTLIARCQEGTAMVVFKNGQVIEAASDTPQESLGSLLVSQGIVGEGAIGAAEQRMKKNTDLPLGAILVDMGAISAKTLEAVVLKQIEHIVHRLVSCEDGFITFDRGETAVNRKINTREFLFPSGVSTEYLLMEGARVIDEERRQGSDRRAQARSPLHGGELPREASLRAGEQEGAGAAMHALLSWFRGIRLPKAVELRSAAVSVVRKGKQIAGSASDLLRRTVAPRLESALGWVRAFSPDGRAMMLAGITVTVVGIALILLFTLSFDTAGGDLVVTGRVVNIRAKPSTTAKVVAKAGKGETLSPVSSREGWHEVRTRTGGTGWVSQRLVERKERKGPGVSYDMKGFELVLVAGLALIVVGIMRRRRIAAAPPRMLREVR